jgi:hypothetical protein
LRARLLNRFDNFQLDMGQDEIQLFIRFTSSLELFDISLSHDRLSLLDSLYRRRARPDYYNHLVGNQSKIFRKTK